VLRIWLELRELELSYEVGVQRKELVLSGFEAKKQPQKLL